MRVTELLYEMANLQPVDTGLRLPIYVGPDSVYGTHLPHDIPRIKIRAMFADVPLTIPQTENEVPDIPKSIPYRRTYKRKINTRTFHEIQQYVYKHREALTDFYHQKITQIELLHLLGIS